MAEVYTEQEVQAVEDHIERFFGAFPHVFHEIVSPDIHVDICIVEPTAERNHYTLVTMGMGAHRMHVPEELRDSRLERAELLITLPADWELQNSDEQWYWPIRWLKILARLPGEQDTWLGWGHTVPAGEPFAGNTELCGVMLTMPYLFGGEAAVCEMPDGGAVNFYQLLPLYENEMNFKLASGADALEERFPDDFDMVLDIARPNVLSRKKWFHKASGLRELLKWEGPAGCLATDRILVDGCRVGYLYREEPERDAPDSGWRFLAGDESEEYMDNPEHSGVYALNTLANYDPDIIPLLHEPYGAAFYRNEDGVFCPCEDRNGG